MPPTFERADRFSRDWKKLSPDQRTQFRAAASEFVSDLRAKKLPRPSLRVKRVQGTDAVWEMTWAADGRATFTYGPEIKPGETHVQWRRVGTHDILDRP